MVSHLFGRTYLYNGIDDVTCALKMVFYEKGGRFVKLIIHHRAIFIFFSCIKIFLFLVRLINHYESFFFLDVKMLSVTLILLKLINVYLCFASICFQRKRKNVLNFK